MRTRWPAVLALLVALSGCATKAEIEQRNAIEDDAKCQSHGAKPGDAAYVQCRAQFDTAHKPS